MQPLLDATGHSAHQLRQILVRSCQKTSCLATRGNGVRNMSHFRQFATAAMSKVEGSFWSQAHVHGTRTPPVPSRDSKALDRLCPPLARSKRHSGPRSQTTCKNHKTIRKTSCRSVSLCEVFRRAFKVIGGRAQVVGGTTYALGFATDSIRAAPARALPTGRDVRAGLRDESGVRPCQDPESGNG
jgi:hypothetical protein